MLPTESNRAKWLSAKNLAFYQAITLIWQLTETICLLWTLLTACFCMYNMSLVMRKPAFVHAKAKTHNSFTVTAKLISAFVFATRIVQSRYFLNTKFQASSHLLWLYRSVCVGPGRKPQRPVFSQRGSYTIGSVDNTGRTNGVTLMEIPTREQTTLQTVL